MAIPSDSIEELLVRRVAWALPGFSLFPVFSVPPLMPKTAFDDDTLTDAKMQKSVETKVVTVPGGSVVELGSANDKKETSHAAAG